MFDWDDDQDQVGDTIWCEFSENEANIMPYANGADKNPLPPLGNYKRGKNDEANTSLRSSEQSSGSKNDMLGINQDNSSTFITSEELIASQLDVDSWPDLPSLSTSLSKEYNDSCNRDAMEAQLMLDISGTKKLDKIRVQFDSPSEIFDNDKDDEENGTFLDCDWANIGDIEDLDNIFSGNDSIFGHEMVGNVDEFLTAASDVISSTVQSISLPDMPLCKDQPSGYDSSSFHLDELPAGKEALEEKREDSTVRARSEYYEEQNLFSNKPNIQKRTLTSHKKSEEKGKCKELDDSSAMWSCSTNESRQLLSSTTDARTKTMMDSFESSTERQVRAPEDVEQLDSPNQFMLSGYAYTAYPFPTIPISQNVYAKTNQEKPLSVGQLLADFSKHPNGLSRLSDSASRPLTPQEKIEKLRRRQKMQAMLAIQQQQQQFAHPSTSDSGVPQSCSPRKQPVESRTNSAADLISNKLLPAERNILADQEEPWTISSIIDGQSLEERCYYQLQDAIEQLDSRVRLCIRDSLFRLAQSAMERQSASDRNSTNKSDRDEDELSAYDDTKKSRKNSKWTSVETGTNPIDRTVAHLLFHKPSELSTRAVKEEIPQSPALYNPPTSNASLQAQACTSNDRMENAREMERQP